MNNDENVKPINNKTTYKILFVFSVLAALVFRFLKDDSVESLGDFSQLVGTAIVLWIIPAVAARYLTFYGGYIAFCIMCYFIFTGIQIQNDTTTNITQAKTKAEIDSFFENMAQQISAKNDTYIDSVTQLHKVEYNKTRTELRYFYKTTGFENGVKLTDDQQILFKTSLIDKGCTALGAFMRQHNLKLVHSYYDKLTGREVINLAIVKSDCKG
jgi:hypothetical protein